MRQPHQRRLRRALRLYASALHLHSAQFPLRHQLGRSAFANTALRTAAGLRRNQAWPCGSSPPPCADWWRGAARLLIGW